MPRFFLAYLFRMMIFFLSRILLLLLLLTLDEVCDVTLKLCYQIIYRTVAREQRHENFDGKLN